MKRSKQQRSRGDEGGDGRKRQPQKGRRFTAEQRRHAVVLVASGMKRVEVAKAMGTTVESIRRWCQEAESGGGLRSKQTTSGSEAAASGAGDGNGVDRPSARSGPDEGRSPFAPKDPPHGLGAAEREAILSQKKRHPSMGPAQIKAQLKRFKGWRLSIRAIDRVLRDAGYEPVHRGSRPQGPEPVRFQAPRPNALWQADFAEVRVDGEKLYLLLVLDDHSRFLVGHGLGDGPSAEVTMSVLDAAMARHGKPEALRTDRGGAFLSREFADYLEAHLIDHVVGRPYRPQGGGKVEALVKTVRRELWDVRHFTDKEDATRQLGIFLGHYNERRAHMGLDGLTPSDRYFGRADRVLCALNDISRGRQGALDRHAEHGAPIEEILGRGEQGPLEVLRLMLVKNVLELRFCGHRVVLGRLEE